MRFYTGWVIRDWVEPAASLGHVRYGPDSDQIARLAEMTRWAMKRREQVQQ
jgi:hypothetical protein